MPSGPNVVYVLDQTALFEMFLRDPSLFEREGLMDELILDGRIAFCREVADAILRWGRGDRLEQWVREHRHNSALGEPDAMTVRTLLREVPHLGDPTRLTDEAHASRTRAGVRTLSGKPGTCVGYRKRL